MKGSPARLWSLVEERTRPGADKAAIDRRIDDLFGEEWAVMFTDLAGFSRRVAEFGIIHFLQVIHEQRKLLLPIVAARDGILIKEEADSFLALFRRPRTALDCALAMQLACRAANEGRAPEERILLCVGLGYGRVLRIGDTDVFGAEVNAASKLGEDTATAYEVLVTGAVRQAVGEVEGVSFEPLDVAVPGARSAFRVVSA
ncbi:adenylate/guanylate cyclase domain-containing protein [Acidobacteria bacterium ACD]|nr:MAG: adenylate/guanylate cyclase domain-containing protein [Acidobacteriota bacterium]MCE7959421.1 adenylate/guanylate cyclase domain-containing protein [Acidobacteria bacterium ACB2]MDL1950162.1 adenylate/guanylate cyclase domain-containing protein [Acidobacteria bacterium ACD]